MEQITATTPNKHMSPAVKVMTSKDLQALDFTFNMPFCINLIDKQTLIVEQVARIIPKKRIVVFGQWQGRSVVAKLFFALSSAKKHMEKDAAGIKKLEENKIPTPGLYYQGKTEDKRIYILIFERIIGADNLEKIYQNKAQLDDVFPVLQTVVKELATQHVFGVLQQDLHFKNYLVTEKIIYTLDGGQVDVFPTLLNKKTSMNNLALFLSQLGVGTEDCQEKLFRYYAKLRGWLLKNDDIKELFFLIKKWSEQRWQRYSKKIFRSSSDFVSTQDWSMHGMIAREAIGPQFLSFLKNPEAVFNHPTSNLLKAGSSATVIQVTLDQRVLVIKRYNIKNRWHGLRRCLRVTRAYASWKLAQKLKLFGVATAKPIAFIEKKWLGLHGKSYYVTEYVSGQHVGNFLKQPNLSENNITIMVKQVSTLLKNLAKLAVTHGDLKMTNILINGKAQPVLIDLDGAAEHLSIFSLHKAWHNEIERFLENFHDQPLLQEKFKAMLYPSHLEV